MPEGPEVKTVARTLAEQLVGHVLGLLWHSHARLRRAVDYRQLKKLENHQIDRVFCYGKVLFISTKAKPHIMAQLGMTGQLKVTALSEPLAPHTHLRWPLKNTSKELRYVDPRRFGLIDACDEHSHRAIIAKLGPDPFSMTEQDFPALIAKMKKSSRAIKEILLDQSVIAGVGNIYASEALYRARINPEARGADLDERSYQALIPALIDILRLAYENSGTSFSNYVDGSGKKGDNLAFLKVFQRTGQTCEQCQAIIKRIKQGGRSTFYCPQCQG